MTAAVFIENKEYQPQIRYVFDTLFFLMGIKACYRDSLQELGQRGDSIGIAYCTTGFEKLALPAETEKLIYIRDSAKLFGRDYLKPVSIPSDITRHRLLEAGKETDILSIYHDGKPLTINAVPGRSIIRTNIDMISDIFFMLTRYEEVVHADKKDRYDRFPAIESLAVRGNFLHRAIVNEHMELLGSWIERLTGDYKPIDRWDGKPFAACLSHDVDQIIKNGSLFEAIRHALAVLLRLKKPRKAVSYLKSYLMNGSDYTKDPYWTFSYLTETERKYQLKSTFFFLALDASDPDFRYDIGDTRVRKLIGTLEADGCEIGYHGSLQSFHDKGAMEQEKRWLGRVVNQESVGCRQHYLRFRAPLTWRIQSQSGILYDTSLSFAEHEGFRCGICLPFKPYDLVEDRVLDIWEIPLLIMEGSLQSTRYRNLSPEDGLKSIISIIDTVKKHRGVFTLLWHNSSFDYDWEEWTPVFEKVMEILGESGCVGLTGKEVLLRTDRTI